MVFWNVPKEVRYGKDCEKRIVIEITTFHHLKPLPLKMYSAPESSRFTALSNWVQFYWPFQLYPSSHDSAVSHSAERISFYFQFVVIFIIQWHLLFNWIIYDSVLSMAIPTQECLFRKQTWLGEYLSAPSTLLDTQQNSKKFITLFGIHQGTRAKVGNYVWNISTPLKITCELVTCELRMVFTSFNSSVKSKE